MIFFAVRVVKSENEISVQELKKMLSEKKKFLLLDCRTKAEFEIAKIGGAKLVPLGELHEKMKEFGQKKEIVVFCHHSGRSKFAAAILSREKENYISLFLDSSAGYTKILTHPDSIRGYRFLQRKCRSWAFYKKQ